MRQAEASSASVGALPGNSWGGSFSRLLQRSTGAVAACADRAIRRHSARCSRADWFQALQILNAVMENLPLTAGREAAKRRATQEAYNRAVPSGRAVRQHLRHLTRWHFKTVSW